jgi:hypothetical protein
MKKAHSSYSFAWQENFNLPQELWNLKEGSSLLAYTKHHLI